MNKKIDEFLNRISKVSLDEIAANDYNLNITRYIDKSEEEEQIEIANVLQEIAEIKKAQQQNTVKLNAYLRELGMGEL